jgi:hypothetical protein
MEYLIRIPPLSVLVRVFLGAHLDSQRSATIRVWTGRIIRSEQDKLPSMVYCTAQGFTLLGFMLASTKGPSCPNSPGAEFYEIACRIEMAAAGTLLTVEWPEPREPFSKWRPNTTVSLKVVLEKATLLVAVSAA